MGNKTSCISVRLSESDHSKIKTTAKTLQVRHSDIMRYAIKTTLTRLSAFHNPELTGPALLPTIIEHCNELNRHFDLDADKLDNIINAEVVTPGRQVARSDIELLALCGMPTEMIQQRFIQATGIKLKANEVYQFMKKYLAEKYQAA
ncbi:hypothetical protein MNBD_GAMMA24-1425 [hydrothermal vent metagenome]|uniref:Uncharacterized protein n=1 Tax=hydrothermal vent metagenome TaxID=652676 RepID=A0A3B1BAM6_9ZZZZ